MKIRLLNNLEGLFGFFSPIILALSLFLSIIFSPNYRILEQYVSDLAYYSGKFFFSVGFAISGVFLVPFFIALERELVRINENLRRLATVISIFTCTCFALVSIIPDETYIDIFIYFHGFLAFFVFFGSGLYIFLYSFLILLSLKSEEYTGPKFHILLVVLGFFTSVGEFLLLFDFKPFLEWIILILILIWIFLTSIHIIVHRFIRFPVTELNQLNNSELREIFEVISEKFEELNIKNQSIKNIVKNNIKILNERNNKLK